MEREENDQHQRPCATPALDFHRARRHLHERAVGRRVLDYRERKEPVRGVRLAAAQHHLLKRWAARGGICRQVVSIITQTAYSGV